MKKIVALLLSVIMVLSLMACGGKDTAKSDLEKVKDAGKLVVGITEFAPMDYKDNDTDKWIGFDAEMATAFAEYLGVDVKFEIIGEWELKHLELNNGSYDCIWNGMTLTDEVKEEMDYKAYCNNHQVVVVRADKVDQYTTEESVANLNFAVERGSAGAAQAEARDWTFAGFDNQAAALTEVKTGASEAAIVDYLMAVAMVGPNTDYSDLAATSIYVSDEELGVGFRKGSDLLAELEKFLEEAYADGTMMECAKKYGLENDIIEQK